MHTVSNQINKLSEIQKLYYLLKAVTILHKLHTDTVCPQRHSRPGYGSPGESTHNRTAPSNRWPINCLRVLCRTIRRRTIRRRQHPHLSHWRSGGVFLPFTHVGRVSLIYTGGASSSHRTLRRILSGLCRQAAQSTTNYTVILLRIY